ncbi:TonB-dependent siderophore receptor [Propylenella binzhouense]|uniref:TonB-dependent siderophore receptor n=1 Tax=Propylenella binzhouense TaxID=2555902 RepID=UPI001967A13D|nr:TonB-dependent siderophore receptor [Propylenella binzhouense]
MRADAIPLRTLLAASTILTGLGIVQARAQEGQADPNGTLLPEVLVEGSSYETEGTGSYTTDLVSVGEKDVRSVREIPQSTTVVTRERLDDGSFTSLDTALRETPGIVVLNNDDGRSSIFSRGFEFDTLYFNGLPAPLSSIYGTQPDMAIVDHIEILRGPAGLYGGAGEPAGAINMRLKQANDEFQASLTGMAGSWDNRRTELDLGGPLNKAGTIRGRIIGAFQTQDSWVDWVSNDVGLAYGTLQADLTDSTTATFTISHMERDIAPFNGLPTLSDGTLLDLPRSTFTGADWNRFDNSVTDYIVELEHRFDDGGHAKLSARYSDRAVDFLYGYAGTAASEDLTVDSMRWLARDLSETSLALDAHVSKPFELFGQEHNIILGADYRNVETTTRQATGSIAGPFDLLDWDAEVPEPTVAYTQKTKTDPEQFGLYGQLRVKPIDRLTLIGGGRLSWYQASTKDLVKGETTSTVEVDGQITPYAGVVLDVTDWASLYASYTEIFQPQAVVDVSGNLLDPREGRQYETGVKAELLDGLNATLAYFNLRDTNRAVADPDNPGFQIAQGEVEADGIEIEASGTVLPGWEVTAGYTYTHTEYLNTEAAGEPFSTYTPEHMLQLWTKYTFDDRFGMLSGAYVGGGLKVFSEFSSGDIEAPGYTVVDLLAGYSFNDRFDAKLVVNNVFDEKYYARVGGTSVFNFYGEPRSATLKVSARF